MTEFEGGLRQSAFVSGGFLPEKMRGKTSAALIHICDWYATFASLAGVDPHDIVPASLGEVPPSDSLDMWPVISGMNHTSPRASMAVTPTTLMVGDWKFIQHQPNVSDSAWCVLFYRSFNRTPRRIALARVPIEIAKKGGNPQFSNAMTICVVQRTPGQGEFRVAGWH